MKDAIFTLKKVDKFYSDSNERVGIFDKLDMTIKDGEFCAILGPSGSGKTTLLNILGGVDTINSGEIWFRDTRIDNLNQSQLTRWRAQNVGFIFQQFNLISLLSAQQNVELPLLMTKLTRTERQRKVAAALELVGLTDRAKHKPAQLSGGQQQRVAIARALVADLPVLLCDEPTGNLDRDTSNEVLETLRLLNKDFGKSIIMVTHDQTAQSFARTSFRLDKGTFIEEALLACA
jgi:ABC-type antimicrobial peptide transport system, ATPase component